jgi:hypothetical protein
VSIAWDETSRDLEVRRRTGYRVDIFLVATQLFQPYSVNGIDKAMAESLAEHLKRNHSGGRIVEVPRVCIRKVEAPRYLLIGHGRISKFLPFGIL